MAKLDNHDSTQTSKFRDLARQIGADEDEKRFEEAVKKVAKVQPKPAKRK